MKHFIFASITGVALCLGALVAVRGYGSEVSVPADEGPVSPSADALTQRLPDTHRQSPSRADSGNRLPPGQAETDAEDPSGLFLIKDLPGDLQRGVQDAWQFCMTSIERTGAVAPIGTPRISVASARELVKEHKRLQQESSAFSAMVTQVLTERLLADPSIGLSIHYDDLDTLKDKKDALMSSLRGDLSEYHFASTNDGLIYRYGVWRVSEDAELRAMLDEEQRMRDNYLDPARVRYVRYFTF